MALAMAKDIRVIVVKLADRLHNMRTIGVMSDEQRKRIARETLDFYAPIANRLGIHHIKVEFEELGFRALYPLRADRIERAVKAARGNRKELMEELRKTIDGGLAQEDIAAVVGREKHLYSIYRKMKTQHKSFAEIMDVFGFRVVVDHVDDCYRALGVVHNLYKPVAGRFKDYIAIPKVNGYQSLHTTLFGMHGVPIEVQIRTRHMEAVAENGIAGHWLYKSARRRLSIEPAARPAVGARPARPAAEGRATRWSSSRA
jgi:GTP diphosphokinase / guanosine-3',5'-bis(diphosphate) 3'-diphosphatase